MDWDELIKQVVSSHHDDWAMIAGMVFLERVVQGDNEPLDYQGHDHIATFKSDVSISMAWGLPCVRDFKEEWVASFINPKAWSTYLDVRYCGVPVLRTTYVAVDEGRVYVPMPSRKDMTVATRYADLIRLLHFVAGNVEEYFVALKRAGFTLVDRKWPE